VSRRPEHATTVLQVQVYAAVRLQSGLRTPDYRRMLAEVAPYASTHRVLDALVWLERHGIVSRENRKQRGRSAGRWWYVAGGDA